VHLIVQVKDNQPTLHDTVAAFCDEAAPIEQVSSIDKNKRLRHETRVVEVFAAKKCSLDADWKPHITAIIRVSRETRTRSSATGLWNTTCEISHLVSDIVPTATFAAHAIRAHWGIENRSHYVRDESFAEDRSRIRCNPGVIARIRSFACNILRANAVTNITDARYRNALGGLGTLLSMQFM
jgi:hypothetical protein